MTEITEGRVCRRTPSGEVEVIHGDMPVANPITWHQGRLFAGECRMGARIMELPLDGGAPRVILDDVPMANAFQVGPDGKLWVAEPDGRVSTFEAPQPDPYWAAYDRVVREGWK